MFKNYLLIAWRQLAKNKLYAGINILGLTVGLAIYLFATMIVNYEENHDTFFEKSDRIFMVGSLFKPSANIGVTQSDGIYTAFAPFIEADVEDLEAIARTVGAEYLLSVEDNHYYERVRFADPAFLTIFDFTYLEGDASALDAPTGILLTRAMAIKLFGDEPALGNLITLDHQHSLYVTAVIDDLPPDTHFNGSLVMDSSHQVIAPLEALNNANGYDLAGNYNNLSSGDNTYLLAPEGVTRNQLQDQLDGVFERHFPDPDQNIIEGIKVRPLVESNTLIWDAVGLPVLDSVAILGLLVLFVAIVNYTNLATAQSLGRAREIGLRKTMGAARRQLIVQFLVESLCVAVISMIIAVAVIEIVVPLFNTASGKGLTIAYLDVLPWLLATTVAVGLVAGAYPAYLITQVSPIDALRDGGAKGVKGGLFRSVMLGLQFAITICILAVVLVIYLQNQKIASSAEIYPKSQIILLERLAVESIRERFDTLKNRLKNIPGVTDVAFSSHVPYEFSNSSTNVSREPGGEGNDLGMNQIWTDEDFFSAYNMDLLLGRSLERAITADTIKEEVLAANVVLNELALSRLGYESAAEALGQVFYQLRSDEDDRALTIVGVLPDQNFQGFHQKIKPTMFLMTPEAYGYGSIRVENVAMGQALADVESVWKEIIPEYPIQARFLDDQFNQIYQLYAGLSLVLGGFGLVALLLSLIGLFGLTAFMAAGRTKEIGVRKVMGATMLQIVRLLIWQFSRPVLWALVVALPLAYVGSNAYLTFFADRISFTGVIVAAAGVLSVLIACAIVAIHAVRVARANPINALRYE